MFSDVCGCGVVVGVFWLAVMLVWLAGFLVGCAWLVDGVLFCGCVVGWLCGVCLCMRIFWSCLNCFTGFCGEFDPGSGRTLAACLTHASRTMMPSLLGGLVANG